MQLGEKCHWSDITQLEMLTDTFEALAVNSGQNDESVVCNYMRQRMIFYPSTHKVDKGCSGMDMFVDSTMNEFAVRRVSESHGSYLVHALLKKNQLFCHEARRMTESGVGWAKEPYIGMPPFPSYF